jgi:predicted DNA-binding transcriptional regulator AlpA
MIYRGFVMTVHVSVPLPPADTLSQTEFAAKLGVSRGTFYNMRHRKSANLPQPLETGLKVLRYRQSEVERYLKYGALWNLR